MKLGIFFMARANLVSTEVTARGHGRRGRDGREGRSEEIRVRAGRVRSGGIMEGEVGREENRADQASGLTGLRSINETRYGFDRHEILDSCLTLLNLLENLISQRTRLCMSMASTPCGEIIHQEVTRTAEGQNFAPDHATTNSHFSRY